MTLRMQTVLLMSNDAAWSSAARRALESRNPVLHVAAVGSLGGVQRIMAEAAPAVIVLEESCLRAEFGAFPGRTQHFESVAAWLSGYAPVVLVADESRREEFATATAAGALDFVAAAELAILPEAVEARLKKITEAKRGAATVAADQDEKAMECAEDFGAVLRHELNNPLTGILGNAELLLADIRRRNDGRLPHGGKERLETIALLAVRLRETVAQLSREWEAHREPSAWYELGDGKRARA